MAKNEFGGEWTEQKIDTFLKYLKAYLSIMSKYPYFKLIYFDGFAGCGEIEQNSNYKSLIEGVALQVLSIEEPKEFDIYYLVEKDGEKAKSLKKKIDSEFPHKKGKAYIVPDDCNKKLIDLSKYLRLPKNSYWKALLFIDPFGMQVDWHSINQFKDLNGVDIWLLVPTGAVNRMLTKSGKISNAWIEKLENFLGIDSEEIRAKFYKEKIVTTLFGPEKKTTKEEKIFDLIIETYIEKLEGIWKMVSTPLPLKNSKGSTIFHFIFATNNATGIKIANQIIEGKN